MNNNTIQEYLTKAEAALDANNPDECISLMKKVLKENEICVDALWLQGVAYEKKGEKMSAFNAFQEAAIIYMQWCKTTLEDPKGKIYADVVAKLNATMEMAWRNSTALAKNELNVAMSFMKEFGWDNLVRINSNPFIEAGVLATEDPERKKDESESKNGEPPIVIHFNPKATYLDYKMLREMHRFNNYMSEKYFGHTVVVEDAETDKQFRTSAIKKELAALNPDYSKKDQEKILEHMITVLHRSAKDIPEVLIADIDIYADHQAIRLHQKAVILEHVLNSLYFLNKHVLRFPQKIRTIIVKSELVYAYYLEYLTGVNLHCHFPALEDEKHEARLIFRNFIRKYDVRNEYGKTSKFYSYFGTRLGYKYIKLKHYANKEKAYQVRPEDFLAKVAEEMAEENLNRRRKEFEEAEANGGMSLEQLKKLANAEMVCGNPDNAKVLVDKIQEQEPDSAEALKLLLYYCEYKDDMEQMKVYENQLKALLKKKPELKDKYWDLVYDHYDDDQKYDAE